MNYIKVLLIFALYAISSKINTMEELIPITHKLTQQEESAQLYAQKIEQSFKTYHNGLCAAIEEDDLLKVAYYVLLFKKINNSVKAQVERVIPNYVSPLLVAIKRINGQSQHGTQNDDADNQQKEKLVALRADTTTVILRLLCEHDLFRSFKWQTPNTTIFDAVATTNINIMSTLLETDIANQIGLSEIESALNIAQRLKNKDMIDLLLNVHQLYSERLQTRGPGNGMHERMKKFLFNKNKAKQQEGFTKQINVSPEKIWKHLEDALEKNNVERINLLLGSQSIDHDNISILLRSHLNSAIEKNDSNKVKMLLDINIGIHVEWYNKNDELNGYFIEYALENYFKFKEQLQKKYEEKESKKRMSFYTDVIPQYNQASEILIALLSKGVSLDIPYKNSSTPLKAAIQAGDSESVKLLLHCGANPTYTGDPAYGGMSAIDYARHCNKMDFVEKILDHVQSEESFVNSSEYYE